MDSERKPDYFCSKKAKIAKNSCDLSSDSTINILDDDSLIEIFTFLPISDRLRIERVSKRWQDLSKNSWSKLEELDLNPEFLGLKLIGSTEKYPEINSDVIEKILKNCGRYLKKIDITSNNLIHGCQLSKVAKYCPKIQSIICTTASVDGIQKVAANCKNISVLQIGKSLSVEFKDALFINFQKVKNAES